MSKFCDDLLNRKLDDQGFRSFSSEEPVKLWECHHGKNLYLIAARDEQEARKYVSNVSGSQDITVVQSCRAHDPKTLIPGILVPDEERSALTS